MQSIPRLEPSITVIRDQREFIQQLMGAASELHSQRLGRVPIEEGKEGSKKQIGQGHHKNMFDKNN